MKFSTTGDGVMAKFYAVGNPSLSTYCYAEYQNSGGSWVITSNALGNFDTQSKSFRMNCYLNHDTEPEKWATFVGWPLNTQKPAIHMGNGRQIVLRGKVTDSCVQLFVPQTNPDHLIPGEGAYVRQVGFYGHW